MALRPKQKKFCDLYIQTLNATKSAIEAGYSKKTAHSIGNENLSKPEIIEYIKNHSKKENNSRIADINERKELLTSILRAMEDGADMKDRLKAIELLGKMEGDFLDPSANKSQDTVINIKFDTVPPSKYGQ